MRTGALVRWASVVALTGALGALGGCGEAPAERRAANPRSEAAMRTQRFPELVNVRPQKTGPSTYDLVVLTSSPYDSPRRYADGWRVLSLAGQTVAEKRLTHAHADEQPFWRRQSGVRVPRGTRRVQLEGHDSRNGYGGTRLTVTLP